MTTYPGPLERLIQELAKLPGIGEKTAARLAFHMLKGKKEDVFALSESIGKLRREMGLCRRCFGFTESDPHNGETSLCTICRNLDREHDKICVVEEPADLIAVERSQEYRGLYHVLHGTISPLDGVGPDALRIKELIDRLGDGSVREVIVATNPTMDGEATALYLSKVIRPIGVMVTRIARG
ncbi:MAG: recombination mediator RecR, partial [Deltaproteobacteria bacterium]|nr:recombination mediator RecR [Deltaproteobacteria bacterium]